MKILLGNPFDESNISAIGYSKVSATVSGVSVEDYYCGYVKLTKSHPITAKWLKKIEENDMDEDSHSYDFHNLGLAYQINEPHGGITACYLNDKGLLVLGFDLAHEGDDESGINDNSKYVIAEVMKFACSLAEYDRVAGHRVEDEVRDKINDVMLELGKITSVADELLEYLNLGSSMESVVDGRTNWDRWYEIERRLNKSYE